MPSEAGIPPEVVDAVLELVMDDTPTLLSCCRASKGFSARVLPLLYRDLEILYLHETRMVGRKHFIEYHLSRSSASLLDTLYVNPSLGKYCAKLLIKKRLRRVEDMVRLRTAPTVEVMTELFERLPYAEELVAPPSSGGQGGYDALNAAIAGALPAFGGPTKTLRRLKISQLDDTSFLPLLACPNLAHLEVVDAKTKYPPPTHPLPPFHLVSLASEAADEALFATLRTLSFRHPGETPRLNRITVLEALPPQLHTLLLDPFELPNSPSTVQLVQNWPTSLKKVYWTAYWYGADWEEGFKEEIEEACRMRGVETVEFWSAAAF